MCAYAYIEKQKTKKTSYTLYLFFIFSLFCLLFYWFDQKAVIMFTGYFYF